MPYIALAIHNVGIAFAFVLLSIHFNNPWLILLAILSTYSMTSTVRKNAANLANETERGNNEDNQEAR